MRPEPAASPAAPTVDHLVLIDGSGLIFRALFAYPPMRRVSDGREVGAVHGFCNLLARLLPALQLQSPYSHIAMIFDVSRKTFRSDLFTGYKAHRPPAPAALAPQQPLFRQATKAFNVAAAQMAGFEADDLIATYARHVARGGGRVTIVSSDKDLMQLVNDGQIELFDPMKAKRLTSVDVIEKFGVPPELVVDVQSLAGDGIDNVPGVPGIGTKRAADLIRAFGSLDALLARVGEVRQKGMRNNLLANAETARLSRSLVALDDDVPVSRDLSGFAARRPDPDALLAFLHDVECNALIRTIEDRP